MLRLILKVWNSVLYGLFNSLFHVFRRKQSIGVLEQRKPVVLITGASTGIGLALVRLLNSERRFHVIATARKQSLFRFDELGFYENESFWIRSLDVTNKAERDILVDEINQKLGGADVLINNAGYSLRAVVEHVGETERFQQMETNFRGPMALVRQVLPKMRERKSGRIINISSVGGMMAMPTMSVYSASKFALEGASEALWYEVKPWNVKVSLVQPGFVNSSSFQNVKMTRESIKALNDKNNAYYYHYHSMTEFIERCMLLSVATPEKIAKKILKTMDSGNPPLRVPTAIDARLFSFLRRILPQQFYHNFLYWCLPSVIRWGED